MVKINLTFMFCNSCSNEITNNEEIYKDLIFNDRFYCSETCAIKGWDSVKKLLDCGSPALLNWEGIDKPITSATFFFKTKNEKINNNKEIERLRKFRDDIAIELENREMVSLYEKKIKEETDLSNLKKEVLRLEAQKIELDEKVKNSWMGRKVRLSHPDKCDRCDKIDARGNYLWITSKERGGEDNKENKVFLCHKCYPIVNTYIDDLWAIYNDAKIVKRFVIMEDSWLDKPLRVNKI